MQHDRDTGIRVALRACRPDCSALPLHASASRCGRPELSQCLALAKCAGQSCESAQTKWGLADRLGILSLAKLVDGHVCDMQVLAIQKPYGLGDMIASVSLMRVSQPSILLRRFFSSLVSLLSLSDRCQRDTRLEIANDANSAPPFPVNCHEGHQPHKVLNMLNC
jgi:hypothetical protein